MTQPAIAGETAAPPRVSAAARRIAMVVGSHPVLDAYAGYVPPLLAVLQVRCGLTAFQAASLLSIGSLTSGLCQPLLAWVTDRIDSRLCGTAGLAVAAAALSCIGLARDFSTLVVLFVVGMLGVGAYHPVAAASIGYLSGARRSMGVSVFFVAGMIGATAGPIISTRITAIEPGGFDLLRWTMIPGLVCAVLLHLAIRDVPHRHHGHRRLVFTVDERRRRWTAMVWLFGGNALRYTVYMSLLYLYVRWAEAALALADPALGGKALTKAGAIFCGELTACTMAGMAVGGVLTGLFVRAGKEKRAIVLIPILLAPAIASLPLTGRVGGYGLAAAAGVGFAALIPVTISVAQRLLPHRTSLASGLMMGGAWAVAAAGPPLTEWGIGRFGLASTFGLTAGVLAVSGLFGLPLSGALLRAVSRVDGETASPS